MERITLKTTESSLVEIANQGLELYYQGDKALAFELLSLVVDFDDHALLCIGWLQIEQGEAVANRNLIERGLNNVKLALEGWTYRPNRTTWQRYWIYQAIGKSDVEYWQEHVTRLTNNGYKNTAAAICCFAKSNGYL